MPKQTTKHEQVIKHIESLAVGDKVSVRRLARDLKISEGTAYRAIKEAENLGFVSSIPKVGTIRIEPEVERSIDTLSYNELVVALEGRFLNGMANGDSTPKAYFVATSLDKLRQKIFANDTLILAEYDREILNYAVNNRIPLLLCGHTSLLDDEMKKASLIDSVIMSTPNELFEAISLINQVIFDRVENRDLLRIEAIMTSEPCTLDISDKVTRWHELYKETGFSRFPVIDSEGVLRGLINARDVANASNETAIKDIMIKRPVTVKKDDLVSYLGRLLVWESVELVPVVRDDKLIGVVSRQDIIEALQSLQKQPQFGETFDNTVMSGFRLVETEPNVILEGKSQAFMTNEFGEVSVGNLSTIAINLSVIALRQKYNEIVEAKQITLNHLKSVGLSDVLTAKAVIYPLRKGEYQVLIDFMVDGEIIAVSTVIVSVRD